MNTHTQIMGKGTGASCERSALSINAPQTSLTQWAEVTNKRLLRRAAGEHQGLERWVIQEQLRSIQRHDEACFGFGAWSLQTAIEQAVQFPGQSQAILLQSGSVKDNVLYLEQYQPRQLTPLPLHAAQWHHLTTAIIHHVIEGDSSLPVHVAIEQLGRRDWSMLTGEQQAFIISRTQLAIKHGNTSLLRRPPEWSDKGKRTWRLHADVNRGNDSALLRLLRQLGGTEERYQLEIPQYRSAHHISEGVKYTASVEGSTLSYVPYEEAGNTPLSERGRLTVTGDEPAVMLNIVQSHAIAGPAHDTVPYELLYGDGPHTGRIFPIQTEYALGDAQIRDGVPRHHLPLHGMTGVSTPEEAVERLGGMIRHGGIKSIAERRRMGFGELQTMSPLGDIASGIDTGVPCTVYHRPQFGRMVYFAMSKDAMARRDVWFAPQDFGAGHSRYRAYNQYAASIGQGDIEQPPSHTARKKHFHTVQYTPANEMYFRHAIPWRDVHTVIVHPDIHADISTMVSAAQQAGAMPSSVAVATMEGTPRADGSLSPQTEQCKEIAQAADGQCRYNRRQI